MIVGVTGHRPNRLPADKRSSVALRIRAALISFQKRADRSAPCTLVTGMAEGSDRYAARAARRLGWRVHALLPLPSDDYVEDFETAASRNEFRRLAALADKLETPSKKILTQIGEAARSRPECYLAQGLDMLSRVDGLLVVWDGAPAAGIGGTVDLMERAQAQNLDVHLVRVSRGSPDG